ncbi:MAG: electron transfer flavoprotein subunit beta/FixA family protein [Deltaproteobacteria bacterium]|nr:electron transfer flavoprotein subunit beta/FixA family protein [Deltaproteobacteria bacterium]
MNSIVCVKQVPDTESVIKIDSEGTGIAEEGMKYVANPYDEFAVEEALGLREKFGEGKVTVITLGPQGAEEAVRYCLAMGADEGILIKDEEPQKRDSLSVAKCLSEVIKDMDYDVIFCGKQAVDDDAAQVGAMLAEFLDVPQATVVTKFEVAEDKKSAVAQKQIEGGEEVIEIQLPAVITAQKGLNEPRFTSLMGIKKAMRSPLEIKEVKVPEAKMKIMSLERPPERVPGAMFEGESADVVRELVEALKNEAKVIR